MTDEIQDRLLIRELVERWAVWRDAGDWDRFATVWHPDGVMMATWFQGPFADFVRVTREGWDKGVSILQRLGGSAIDVVDYLEKRRTPVSRLDVAVDAMRDATPPRRVRRARLDFAIDGDGIDAVHAERSIALALSTYCSVGATLAPDVELSTRLTLNGITGLDVVHRVGMAAGA